MNGIIVWSPGVSLEDIEKQVILKAFVHYRENKTATAGALGISIRTLDTKLEKYDADTRNQGDRDAERRQERANQLARHRGQQPEFVTPAVPTNERTPQGHKAHAGVRMESVANAAPEQAVPVPQRQEVQSVLPRQATGGSSRRSR